MGVQDGVDSQLPQPLPPHGHVPRLLPKTRGLCVALWQAPPTWKHYVNELRKRTQGLLGFSGEILIVTVVFLFFIVAFYYTYILINCTFVCSLLLLLSVLMFVTTRCGCSM